MAVSPSVQYFRKTQLYMISYYNCGYTQFQDTTKKANDYEVIHSNYPSMNIHFFLIIICQYIKSKLPKCKAMIDRYYTNISNL